MSRQQEETTITLQPTTEPQDQQPESVIPPQQCTNVTPVQQSSGVTSVQQSSGVTFAQQPADTPVQQSENVLPSNNHDQQSIKISTDEKRESPEGQENQLKDKVENEEDDLQTVKINCPEKIVCFSIFDYISYQFYLTSAAEMINYMYTVN